MSNGGTVLSGGTEAKPVAFCGETAEAGTWSGVSISDDAADSQLSYTLISNAGSGDTALLLDAPTLVDHLAVTDSGSDGVHASIFAKDSATLTVTGAQGAPVVLTHAAAVSPFPLGGDLTGNGDDVVLLDFEESEVDMTFGELGVPYFQPGDLDILAGDVEFLAGVVYHLAEGVTLDVGSGSETVRFDVKGTGENPVEFEGPGEDVQYLRIRLNGLVSEDSAIRHAAFRYGGGAFDVYPKLVLEQVLVEKSGSGLRIAKGFASGSSGISVRDCGQEIIIAPNAIFSIPADTKILGDFPLLLVSAGTLTTSGTLVDIGVAYTFSRFDYFPSSADPVPFDIASDVTLEVAAGGQLALTDWHTLVVHGALRLRGTAAKPVKVTMAQFTDYSTIEVAADADDSTTFDYVQFSGGEYCLTIRKPVAVANSTFTDCTTAGIYASTLEHTQSEYNAALGDTNTFTDSGDMNPLFF
ncbi:MAG TPA: hypothetical protein VLC09_13060 [Polyangiaceae bacterium]|nr:hypothetical protein [Polyangiaceae bacterium]